MGTTRPTLSLVHSEDATDVASAVRRREEALLGALLAAEGPVAIDRACRALFDWMEPELRLAPAPDDGISEGGPHDNA